MSSKTGPWKRVTEEVKADRSEWGARLFCFAVGAVVTLLWYASVLANDPYCGGITH